MNNIILIVFSSLSLLKHSNNYLPTSCVPKYNITKKSTESSISIIAHIIFLWKF